MSLWFCICNKPSGGAKAVVHRSHFDVEGLGDRDQVVGEFSIAEESDDLISQMRNWEEAGAGPWHACPSGKPPP